ncbi:PepSY domain-containing protein [Patulibacter sp.]|uniref:PepSY domain-containing protein n=1 Tax=Patulibacter sp. TaxID=1912859 RepID=UPI0027230FBD|nr:PepSY domain-containing protein [Patulibacter sp.]MDO9410658.1 hypothetical protein [Patulibacter sp.]
MTRTRTALIAVSLAAATAAGGVAIAGADDRAADTGQAVLTAPADAATGSPAPVSRTRAGDDGLTHAQATKARRAALRQVPGRAVQIERDADDGAVTYDVKVLTRGGRAREVHLDSAFRVARTTREDRDGLTYASAGRAGSAATKRVKGLVTGIDTEDDGRVRYEVEVLTAGSTERVVRLSSSFGVVTGQTGDDDGDDD